MTTEQELLIMLMVWNLWLTFRISKLRVDFNHLYTSLLRTLSSIGDKSDRNGATNPSPKRI